jgi:RNA polymerase sigma-70 factor (ECF subfamily)
MTADGVQPDPGGRDLSSGSPSAPRPGSLVQVRGEWTDFYDTHYHQVVRFLMLNGASRAEAEDAAQEAFLESWDMLVKDPDRWQAVTGKAAWIRTVALRRRRRPPGPRRRPLMAGDELPDLPADCPGHDVLTAQTQLVLHALRALDEEARAVMAFDMDGIPAADAAAALGITQQRVRDVRKKARPALKKLLTGTAAHGRRQP